MRNTLTYQTQEFENDQIKNSQMAVDTSLNERVLDVDTMNATVQSQTSLVPFQQNTPVRFLRGGSQYALWYLSEIRRIAGDLYSLSMTSSLGRLTQMEHKGGIYNGVAASVIIDDICGVVPHFVGAAFQNVLLYGWLPYVAPSGENGAQTGSAKDNLLKVLFALNATVRDDANGTLRIENLSTAVSAQLGADRIYRDNASVLYEPTVTGVTVLEHQYITGSETTTLFEGTTVDGQVIVFREPMSNLSATGFTVTESNANYAVVSAGSGTLTGTPYIHTTREITKPVTTAAIPNIVRIEDATLVGVTNSSDVVNRLVDYYSHRTYINVDATIDFEDAGDVVEIYDPFDKVLRQACIEKISPLVVSQTMKGRVSALVGFMPWQVVPFEDVRELLTGSGTWTVPEGVTEVTAVLIGGGQGGSPGEKGTDTPRPTLSSETSRTGTSTEYNRGILRSESASNAGGKSGEPGRGGKIFRVLISVSANQQFTFSCGVGGAGAIYGVEEDGTEGTDSSFGSYSSVNGYSSDAGFSDIVSGIAYGAKGFDGMPGNNGVGYVQVDGVWQLFTPDDIVVDGVSYSAGSQGPYNEAERGNYNQDYGFFGSYASGGYGGGNAYKGNGGNGSAGSPSVSNTPPSLAFLYIGNPGSGADAQPYPKETIPGQGGRGGNGGGGAGAPGFPNYVHNVVGPNATYKSNSLGVNTGLITATGGKGSNGGEGADGCIILYYRKPVTE